MDPAVKGAQKIKVLGKQLSEIETLADTVQASWCRASPAIRVEDDKPYLAHKKETFLTHLRDKETASTLSGLFIAASMDEKTCHVFVNGVPLRTIKIALKEVADTIESSEDSYITNTQLHFYISTMLMGIRQQADRTAPRSIVVPPEDR